MNRIQRDHYIITSHSRTGAGKYLFKVSTNSKTSTQHDKATGFLSIGFKGNERMDIPDLTIEKFHIMEDIGPSYKFAFNQAYVGMIIWARKVKFNYRSKIEVSYRFFRRRFVLDPAFLRLLNPKVIWQ